MLPHPWQPMRQYWGTRMLVRSGLLAEGTETSSHRKWKYKFEIIARTTELQNRHQSFIQIMTHRIRADGRQTITQR